MRFRNPVYREFYFAKSVALNANRNWEALTQADSASHYLALFFLHHIEDRDLQPFTGFLFHFIALLASASKGNDFLFSLIWDAQQKAWIGSVQSNTINTDQFKLSDGILMIEIPQRGVLQNVAISSGVDCVVSVSGPGHDRAFEEPVVLRECLFQAGDVLLNAAGVRFESVRIDTSTMVLEDVVSRLEGLDGLSLGRVGGQAPTVRTSKYVENRWGKAIRACVDDDGVGAGTFQRKLAKLLLWFRKHGRPDYACYDKKFQTCALNNNRDHQAVALADFLFSSAILGRDESVVVLDQNALATYDIAYVKHNELGFGPRADLLFDALKASPYWAAFSA